MLKDHEHNYELIGEKSKSKVIYQTNAFPTELFTDYYTLFCTKCGQIVTKRADIDETADDHNEVVG